MNTHGVFKLQTLLLLAMIILAHILFVAPTTGESISVHAYYLSPEHMKENAVAIVHVSILGMSTVVIDENVYTDAECRIIAVLKGLSTEVDKIVVRQLGGRFGELVTVSGPNPQFKEKQEWILCLARPPQGWWTVYGIKHGAFQIDGEMAIRDFKGFMFSEPLPPTVTNNRETMSVAELRSRLVVSLKAPPFERPDEEDKKENQVLLNARPQTVGQFSDERTGPEGHISAKSLDVIPVNPENLITSDRSSLVWIAVALLVFTILGWIVFKRR